MEHKIRFSVILEAATGDVLEKKVLIKMTIQKIAIKALTSSKAFFKDYNCKLESLFFKTGFSGLLPLCVDSLFTSLNLHYSGALPGIF